MVCWPAEAGSTAANAAGAETLVLRVKLNTEEKGDLFVARTADLDFLVKVEDLKAMGFKDPAGSVVLHEGEPHLSLKSMRGVSFSFDQRTLELEIMAEPGLLPSRTLQIQAQRTLRVSSGKGPSAFFNYALDYARTDATTGSTIGFAGEVGMQIANHLFLTDFNSVQLPDGGRKLVRLTTSVTRDHLDDLRRTVIGDFFTPSRDLSTGVNLGGLSISKLYGLNPYLVHTPTQSLSGTVALPSDLEVYLDGQRIRTERLRPGEFELRDLQSFGGARSVRLVLRDSFGRVQEFNYSFYFSDQPLKQGLHEYSYNLGAIRRDYGQASNHYGPAAFSLFHRYGLTDAITLGLRAEGKHNFYNAGPLATVVLGSAGVVNAALAASSNDGLRGGAASAAYNYQTQNWSVGVAMRRDWGDYATLGDPPTFSDRRHEGSAIASYNFPGWGAVSFSHTVHSTGQRTTAAAQAQAQNIATAPLKQRVTALSYSVPLRSSMASLTARLSHIKDTTSRNELTLSLVVFLSKDYSVAANFLGNKAEHTERIEFTKNQPIGEGLGYVLVADRSTDLQTQSLNGRSSVQYNATAAILRGEYSRRQGSNPAVNDYRLSAAGGVAYVGGNVAFGRPVTGSYGLVTVGKLPGVAVLVNGQPMGKTNAEGTLFVPTLNPYFDNDVSIAPETVPIEYSISATSRKVAPSLRGGLVIEFAVSKMQAFTGKLKYQDEGAIKPVEFLEVTFSADGKSQDLQTGRGGEFYVENLKPGTYAAKVLVDGKPCLFDLVIPKSEETFVELGEVTCRLAP